MIDPAHPTLSIARQCRLVSISRSAFYGPAKGEKGRWMDNVFIERLRRSLKYECIYLRAFETGSELRAGLRGWIDYYNAHRPHSALGGRTPDEAHAGLVGYDAAA